jgi:nitrile hydratase beta subunit
MNGVHDMGGMQDMGPIQYEKNEPVFHAPWEARVYGLMRTLGAQGNWSLDAFRHQIELIPPADYFRMSYYEKWLASLTGLMVKTDLVTAAEIDRGKAAPDRPKATPQVTAANAVAVAMTRPAPLAQRDLPGAPKLKVGERVRARNINPVGHTRLPHYARGKSGTIERDHGVFVFPDTNAHVLGEKPQHVYSVRFSAHELWGEEAAPRDSVYLDLFDDYLEPA